MSCPLIYNNHDLICEKYSRNVESIHKTFMFTKKNIWTSETEIKKKLSGT